MNKNAKILKKINQIQNHIKRSYTMTKLIYPWVTKMLQHMQIKQGDNHINKGKDINHMIILIDAGKAFSKIQHPLMTKEKKTLMKVGIEGIHLNTLKVIYDKPTAHSQYNTQR